MGYPYDDALSGGGSMHGLGGSQTWAVRWSLIAVTSSDLSEVHVTTTVAQLEENHRLTLFLKQ